MDKRDQILICHDGSDKASDAAAELARLMTAIGLEAFLVPADGTLARDASDEIESWVNRFTACLIVVGSSGLPLGQVQPLGPVLRRAASEPLGFPLVLILLPGATRGMIPSIPSNDRWYSFPKVVGETGVFEDLVRVVTRTPGPRTLGPEAIDRRADILYPLTDRVTFSMTSCSRMSPGQDYTLVVWVHFEKDRSEILKRAKQSHQEKTRIQSKMGVRIARFTTLTVRLAIPNVEILEAEDTVYWDGEIGNCTFSIHVPASCASGPHTGTATCYVNALPIAKLNFEIQIDTRDKPADLLPTRQRSYRSAFASYASQDRDDVLARIQGIQKVLPQFDIFLDVASLRSGEKWRERLEQEIATREILYLFWSEHARKSKWVEREWRTALRVHGIDGIDPFPLASPEDVPPPKELGDQLHFNDWVLAFRRARTSPGAHSPSD